MLRTVGKAFLALWVVFAFGATAVELYRMGNWAALGLAVVIGWGIVMAVLTFLNSP